MRFGVFTATFAGLLAVLAITIPVPGSFPARAGPSGQGWRQVPECIAFLTTRNRWSEPLPEQIKLVNPGPEGAAEPHGWHLAISSSRRFGRHDDGRWRRVGPDSIDVVPSYHGVVLRLQLGQDGLRGRGGAAYYGSLVEALFARDQFAVRARNVDCT